MRNLDAPQQTVTYALSKCISGISSPSLRDRVIQIENDIVNEESCYLNRASHNLLHTTPYHNYKDTDVVVGGITKKELTNLYSNYMVPKNKPGREIYDSLISKVPFFKCPFCGLVRASTLDHFLPKTSFPLLAIVPMNLIPSCKDCNTGKNTAVARSGSEQSLHPYFDKVPFYEEQWLFAKVIDGDPLAVEYFASPPSFWSEENKCRVDAHLKSFELCKRYSEESATELAAQKYIFDKYVKDKDYENLLAHLDEQYHAYKASCVNSWQGALYQALFVFYKNKFERVPTKNKQISMQVCPRCKGKKQLLNANCDACDGVGAAPEHHFEQLGDQLYEPVVCNCVFGPKNCRLCKGTGRVELERARDI
ncbi:TPA: hypothetical protein I7788_20335 [Vibrio vulnificus]|nr:hypothetical protein [Vibrio vulnificus]